MVEANKSVQPSTSQAFQERPPSFQTVTKNSWDLVEACAPGLAEATCASNPDDRIFNEMVYCAHASVPLARIIKILKRKVKVHSLRKYRVTCTSESGINGTEHTVENKTFTLVSNNALTRPHAPKTLYLSNVYLRAHLLKH